MNRKLHEYIFIIFKGMAMGAADVVPGVSGGTIAFITGIYEELINSIKSINLKALKVLTKDGFPAFWNHINGSFLLSVVLGIALSVISLARVIKELLESEPILLWSFFFGLIVASAITVGKSITKWDILNIASIVVGAVAGYLITALTPSNTPETFWFLIITGSIAICAMILPGISGSFILLILGKYAFVLDAIHTLDIYAISMVGIGALIGILSFSNVLSWLLTNFKNATTAILAGFMIGSLNKVWPWKQVLETYVNSDGEVKPLVEKNILPAAFEQISKMDSQLYLAIGLAVVGFFIIILFDKVIKE